MDRRQYRQGDVLIIRVSSSTLKQISAGASHTGDSVVLARGEATGHAHVVRSSGVTWTESADGDLLVTLCEPGRVEHEEHSAIALDAGTYRVVRQREYDPERDRYVAD